VVFSKQPKKQVLRIAGRIPDAVLLEECLVPLFPKTPTCGLRVFGCERFTMMRGPYLHCPLFAMMLP
jgi:hypothetical protein